MYYIYNIYIHSIYILYTGIYVYVYNLAYCLYVKFAMMLYFLKFKNTNSILDSVRSLLRRALSQPLCLQNSLGVAYLQFRLSHTPLISDSIIHGDTLGTF